MTIAFTPNLVSFPIKVTLADPQFGPGKKYYTPIGKQISYVVSNNQYFLSYSGDRALPGNSLSAPATMTLPVDNSISLFESDKFIGYYDPESNEWSLVTPASTSTQITTGVTTFGEYSVLAENLPLGISDVAVLPDPFSPMVAPLKIGYRLNSLQPPASITIKIYNMRGELVRALLQNDLQMPGLYGSADRGIKSIVWDGKTDNGNDALNGRYLIRITAKDPSGETSTLTPVVLIK
jgi:hypothetical protein